MSPAFLRFGKYTLVGTTTFTFDLLLLFLLVDTFSISQIYAAGMAFVVAVSLNYWVSRKFVFAGTLREAKAGYANFLLIAGMGLFIVTGGMYILTTLGVGYLVARAVIAAITGFWNYLMNLYVNFKVAGVH
jgi:putative flippase GtrA